MFKTTEKDYALLFHRIHCAVEDKAAVKFIYSREGIWVSNNRLAWRGEVELSARVLCMEDKPKGYKVKSA